MGADEEGGGAVVGRAPRTEEEKTGAPSVRALTEGRAVSGAASALRFKPDTSAIVGLFLGDVRFAVEADAFSLFSAMRGEKDWGLVRGAGGVVRALG